MPRGPRFRENPSLLHTTPCQHRQARSYMLCRWCQTQVYGTTVANVLLPNSVPSAYSCKRFDLPDFYAWHCLLYYRHLVTTSPTCYTTFASMGGPADCKRVYCMRKVDRELKQSVRPRVLYIYCFSGSNAPRYHTLSVFTMLPRSRGTI